MFGPDYSKIPRAPKSTEPQLINANFVPTEHIDISFNIIAMPVISSEFPKQTLNEFMEECYWLEQLDLLKGINHGE